MSGEIPKLSLAQIFILFIQELSICYRAAAHSLCGYGPVFSGSVRLPVRLFGNGPGGPIHQPRSRRSDSRNRRDRTSRYHQPGGAVRFTSDVKVRMATPLNGTPNSSRPGPASEGGDRESDGAAKGSLSVPFHKTPSVISHHGPWANATCETRYSSQFSVTL